MGRGCGIKETAGGSICWHEVMKRFFFFFRVYVTFLPIKYIDNTDCVGNPSRWILHVRIFYHVNIVFISPPEV